MQMIQHKDQCSGGTLTRPPTICLVINDAGGPDELLEKTTLTEALQFQVRQRSYSAVPNGPQVQPARDGLLCAAFRNQRLSRVGAEPKNQSKVSLISTSAFHYLADIVATYAIVCL